MGWRAQDAYDRAMEEDERRWLASLTSAERRRVRMRQALRVALLLAIPAALIFGIWRG